MKQKLIILFLIFALPILTFGQANDTLLQPKLIVNDTTIINNTDLKVYLLFNIADYQRYQEVNGILLTEYFEGVRICQDDFLTIGYSFTSLKITPEGLYKCKNVDETCNRPKIKIHGFGSNFATKTGKKSFKSRFGKIEVNRQTGCMDTGRNPVTILHNKKTLQFKNIGNLVFFEFDGDNDGKTELYIVNYFICDEHLEIYKIDDK